MDGDHRHTRPIRSRTSLISPGLAPMNLKIVSHSNLVMFYRVRDGLAAHVGQHILQLGDVGLELLKAMQLAVALRRSQRVNRQTTPITASASLLEPRTSSG